jgi:hypothetical protein
VKTSNLTKDVFVCRMIEMNKDNERERYEGAVVASCRFKHMGNSQLNKRRKSWSFPCKTISIP